MFENAAPVWGTYLNNVFDLVDLKYQTNHAGDVFDKARSDQAKMLGEINSKNRGVFQQGKTSWGKKQ